MREREIERDRETEREREREIERGRERNREREREMQDQYAKGFNRTQTGYHSSTNTHGVQSDAL